jgi:hypothetical protein
MYETGMSQAFTLFSRNDALCIECIAVYRPLQLLLQYCRVTSCFATSSYFLRIWAAFVNAERFINQEMHYLPHNSNNFRGVHSESQLIMLNHKHIYVFEKSLVYLLVWLSYIYVFLLLGLCILIVQLPWLRVFRAFLSVVRQMPGYMSPRRGTASTVPIYFCVVLCICFFLCCSMYFFLSFFVLFVCKCVLYCCHWVSTQLQLTDISNMIVDSSIARTKHKER